MLFIIIFLFKNIIVEPIVHMIPKVLPWVLDDIMRQERASLHREGFRLEDYQLSRYESIQRSSKRKIVVALGVGGAPSNNRAVRGQIFETRRNQD